MAQVVTGQIDRRWLDKHEKLLAGMGDLGREPVYQEFHQFVQPINQAPEPSGWKGLNELLQNGHRSGDGRICRS
ncbi:hypothetical protein ACFTWS_27825 [Streptomyces sp. NPDC057027]|uniref:hypothetical protein n=1 Tax=Streptomyces sp. NPDC057027 TaxID=3346004 RepID=UPI00362CA468